MLVKIAVYPLFVERLEFLFEPLLHALESNLVLPISRLLRVIRGTHINNLFAVDNVPEAGLVCLHPGLGEHLVNGGGSFGLLGGAVSAAVVGIGLGLP